MMGTRRIFGRFVIVGIDFFKGLECLFTVCEREKSFIAPNLMRLPSESSCVSNTNLIMMSRPGEAGGAVSLLKAFILVVFL